MIGGIYEMHIKEINIKNRVCNRFKQGKALKKEISRELMLVVWHSARWWDWCVPEEKKIKTTIFY